VKLRRSRPGAPAAVAVELLQDLALAALLGGNLFGRLGMHPALAGVSGKAERGKVLNDAWRRYGTINSLALVSLVGGWSLERRDRSGPLGLGGADPRRRLVKDVAVGGVVLSGVAAAASGVGFAQQAPDGAVPMASGHNPAPETPGRAVRLKRLVNVLGGLNLATEFVLLGINAAR
jgi:hypothetical protein